MERFEDVMTRWAAAEAAGDADALAAVLDPGFRGDGPGGAVFDRDGWLALHRTRGLVRVAFAWRARELRVGPAAAVATGVIAQVARHRGTDWSGAFASTVVALRDASAWRVVNVQLSERIAQDRPPRGLDSGQVADVLRAALYERGRHADHH